MKTASGSVVEGRSDVVGTWFTRPEPPLKRVVDVVLSMIGIILTLPAWIVIPIAIKLEDGGDVFFGHDRTGKGGERFTLWKFRSMTPNHDLALNKGHPDASALTRVGKIIRPFGLDELPQLWNVLRGEMSLVGPRPFQTWNRDDGIEEAPGFRERHSVKPGLTGLAQVNLSRDSTFEEYFRHDLRYIERRSIQLDLWLIVRSVLISIIAKWPDVGEE